MIISKNVKIKVNSRLFEHYKSKGYTFKCLDEISVNIKDLSPGSHTMVKMCCDNCKLNKDVRYSSLNDKINYNWLCKSCIRKELLSSGVVKNNFKDKKLQKELANRNTDKRIKKSRKTKKEKCNHKLWL